MKRLLLSLALVLFVSCSLLSAETNTWSKPQTLTAQAGVGLYWGGLGQVAGGFDYGLVQVPFSSTFPLDLGVSARAALASNALGAGVYGTAHYSWKALRSGADWLDRLEMGLGIGLGILPAVGLDAYGTVAYHFDQRWAFFVEGAMFGGVLGVSYRF